MKKLTMILLLGLLVSTAAQASKLSEWMNKQDQEQQRQDQERQQELQQQAQARRQHLAEQRARDLNFADNDFRFQSRSTNGNNERCRTYSFRSHNDPYKHGTYTVCYGGRRHYSDNSY